MRAFLSISISNKLLLEIMSTNLQQISIPKFIHCENEPKTGDFLHDNRQFIYCTEYLSLIEIIPVDDFQIQYSMDLMQKNYSFEDEEFLLVYLQNNVNQINQMKEIEYLQKGLKPISEIELMNQAFDYYSNYLENWEN